MHGTMKAAWFTELVASALGPDAFITELEVRYFGVDLVGANVLVSGVFEPSINDGGRRSWIGKLQMRNGNGVVTTSAMCTVRSA